VRHPWGKRFASWRGAGAGRATTSAAPFPPPPPPPHVITRLVDRSGMRAPCGVSPLCALCSAVCLAVAGDALVPIRDALAAGGQDDHPGAPRRNDRAAGGVTGVAEQLGAHAAGHPCRPEPRQGHPQSHVDVTPNNRRTCSFDRKQGEERFGTSCDTHVSAVRGLYAPHGMSFDPTCSDQ